MPKSRPPYPPEFKRRMVELVHAGRKPEELSREFEPSSQAIHNWVKQADLDEGKRKDGLTTLEREELARLRRENKHLRLEREILSKVAPNRKINEVVPYIVKLPLNPQAYYNHKDDRPPPSPVTGITGPFAADDRHPKDPSPVHRQTEQYADSRRRPAAPFRVEPD